jgi:hypothetical protein
MHSGSLSVRIDSVVMARIIEKIDGRDMAAQAESQ